MKNQITCPLCENIVQYNHQLDFWECWNCGTEVWPGTRETKKSWCNKNILMVNGKLGVRQIEKIHKIPERKGGSKYKRLRFEIFKRDNFTCRYCGRTPSKDDVVLELDHIVPVVDGGRLTYENLITACRDCNQGKGAMSLR